MADAIAINKADGNNIQKANLAKAMYQNALHLFPPTESNWTPKVITCSALENTGIADIWGTVLNYLDLTENNGFYRHNRNGQAKFCMHQTIQEAIKDKFYQDKKMKEDIAELEKKVVRNEMSSFVAANKLIDLYFAKK